MLPFLVRCTYCDITSTMSFRDRTSSMISSEKYGFFAPFCGLFVCILATQKAGCSLLPPVIGCGGKIRFEDRLCIPLRRAFHRAKANLKSAAAKALRISFVSIPWRKSHAKSASNLFFLYTLWNKGQKAAPSLATGTV